MLDLIAKYWWTFVIRGLLAIAFGLIALVWPGITLIVLVFLFGFYAILEGILSIIAAVINRGMRSWWVLLLEGLASLIVGCAAFIWPGLTAVVLLIFIAIWAILTGLLEIWAAVQLRKEIRGEWILALTGIISILIGIILFTNPGAGALAVVWMIGIYAAIFGALLIFLGVKFRKLGSTH
ncbi:MAG: HdeD family acid-resistance protein [Desulfobacterales bacterium]